MASNPMTFPDMRGVNLNMEAVLPEERFDRARGFFDSLRARQYVDVKVTPNYEERLKILLHRVVSPVEVSKYARVTVGGYYRNGSLLATPTNELLIGDIAGAEDWEIELAMAREFGKVRIQQDLWNALAGEKGLDGEAYPLVQAAHDEEVPVPYRGLFIEYAKRFEQFHEQEMSQFFLDLRADLAMDEYYQRVVEKQLSPSQRLVYLASLWVRLKNDQKTFDAVPNLSTQYPEQGESIQRAQARYARLKTEIASLLSSNSFLQTTLSSRTGPLTHANSDSYTLNERLIVLEGAENGSKTKASLLEQLAEDFPEAGELVKEHAQNFYTAAETTAERLNRTTWGLSFPLRAEFRLATEHGHDGLETEEWFGEASFMIQTGTAYASGGKRWNLHIWLSGEDLSLIASGMLHAGLFITNDTAYDIEEQKIIDLGKKVDAGVMAGGRITLRYELFDLNQEEGLALFATYHVGIGLGVQGPDWAVAKLSPGIVGIGVEYFRY